MIATYNTPATIRVRSRGSGLIATVKTCWMSHLTRRIAQAAIIQLHGMSDRELQDIGLTRCQIERVVREELIHQLFTRQVLRMSKTIRQLSILLFTFAILSGTADLARAGVCRDDTRDLRQEAQLAHRPTPESVSQAQTHAELMFAAELAHAEAEDVLEHEGDCLLAARRAKEMLQIQ
jgi:uncharacterized protein YjiS (DUF1127 family)